MRELGVMHYGGVQWARERGVLFLGTMVATGFGKIVVGFGACDGCVLMLDVAVGN